MSKRTRSYRKFQDRQQLDYEFGPEMETSYYASLAPRAQAPVWNRSGDFGDVSDAFSSSYYERRRRQPISRNYQDRYREDEPYTKFERAHQAYEVEFDPFGGRPNLREDEPYDAEVQTDWVYDVRQDQHIPYRRY